MRQRIGMVIDAFQQQDHIRLCFREHLRETRQTFRRAFSGNAIIQHESGNARAVQQILQSGNITAATTAIAIVLIGVAGSQAVAKADDGEQIPRLGDKWRQTSKNQENNAFHSRRS